MNSIFATHQNQIISETEFQKVHEEYESLKANRLIHRQFRKIPNDKFYEAMFPSVRLDTMFCPSNQENDRRQKQMGGFPGQIEGVWVTKDFQDFLVDVVVVVIAVVTRENMCSVMLS